MAQTLTDQDFQNAKIDIEDIGQSVNESMVITPRYGAPYKSIPMLSSEAQTTINEWQAAINTIVINGGVPALAVSDAGGSTQQDINDFGGAKWRNKAGGYALGSTVKLNNGDIVKSTIDGNTNDPNVDMSGWKNPIEDLEKSTQNRVSIFDFIPKAQAKLILNGDINQDITPSVLAACTSGAQRVDFAGVKAVCSAVILSGVKNLNIWGNNAELRKPAGSGTNTLIFQLKGGCDNVKIYDFAELDGGYPSTNGTTGSNPVILIGDQVGTGDGGNTNQRIHVFGNNIRRSNWGGVVVYGRSNNDKTLTPLNKNIKIYSNTIEDCGGNGIFVYKNADDVTITGNTIDGVATDGIIFDTMAASDAVTSEPIKNVLCQNNTVKNFGKVGQGIGILAKGDVTAAVLNNNNIRDGLLQPSGSFINYGILINKDANATLTAPQDVTISGNNIRNLQASLTSIGLQVGEGCKSVSVVGNNVSQCSNAGIYINADNSGLTVIGNNVKSCGNGTYGYRVEGASGREIKNALFIGNTFSKGDSTAVGGFKFDYIIDGVQFGNSAPDFTSSAVNVTNSVRFNSKREFTGTAVPTVGTYATGDILVNTNATTVNPVSTWRCVVGGTPGTWRAASWVTGKAPTANRPALTASDIGVMYLDTTLAANGKPIWWNGLAWVDATGVAV